MTSTQIVNKKLTLLEKNLCIQLSLQNHNTHKKQIRSIHARGFHIQNENSYLKIIGS